MKKLIIALIMVLALSGAGFASGWFWDGGAVVPQSFFDTSMTNSTVFPGMLTFNSTWDTAGDSQTNGSISFFIPIGPDFCSGGAIKDLSMTLVAETTVDNPTLAGVVNVSGNATFELASTAYTMEYRTINSAGNASDWSAATTYVHNMTGATPIYAMDTVEIPFQGQIVGGIEPNGAVQIRVRNYFKHKNSYNSTRSFCPMAFNYQIQRCETQ